MKAPNTQTEPKIDVREDEHYLGIRFIAPFKGMLGAADSHKKELKRWVTQHGLEGLGPYFLRFHVIDMSGQMDLEVGVKTAQEMEGDERVKPGVLPAGKYASLIYRGSGYQGHHTLLTWIRNTEGISSEVDEKPDGDHFACRYEATLTDERAEPRKLLRDIELSIKLRD